MTIENLKVFWLRYQIIIIIAAIILGIGFLVAVNWWNNYQFNKLQKERDKLADEVKVLEVQKAQVEGRIQIMENNLNELQTKQAQNEALLEASTKSIVASDERVESLRDAYNSAIPDGASEMSTDELFVRLCQLHPKSATCAKRGLP